jgi:hypothetical protein
MVCGFALLSPSLRTCDDSKFQAGLSVLHSVSIRFCVYPVSQRNRNRASSPHPLKLTGLVKLHIHGYTLFSLHQRGAGPDISLGSIPERFIS